MKFMRCEGGHYFDPMRYESCPHCIGGTQDTAEITVAKSPIDEQVMRAYDTAPRGHGAHADVSCAHHAPPPVQETEFVDDPVTVAKVQQDMGFRPVVGWLVCVGGPSKGEVYNVYTERNSLGRSASMSVCIKGDLGISRENNAIISYNPRNIGFHILPGEGKAIVYLNGEELMEPKSLADHDCIEISQTKLVFVPLCTQSFQWD